MLIMGTQVSNELTIFVSMNLHLVLILLLLRTEYIYWINYF
jgi:hypothetical protein